MRFFLKTICFLCLAVFWQGLEASSISVDPLVADLSYNNRYQDIMVHNVGNDTAYVALQIFRLDNPGLPTQKFTLLEDNPYQIGLIATPNKLIVPMGQTRIIRALYIGPPPQSDVVYQVVVKPVTGQLVAVQSGAKDVNTGVQVIIAYGVTLYVRPAVLNPKMKAVRTGTSLSLSNVGNTTVQIGHCRQCTDASGKQCQIVPKLGKTLYPGNVWNFTLPAAAPLLCEEEVKQNQYFPFNIP